LVDARDLAAVDDDGSVEEDVAAAVEDAGGLDGDEGGHEGFEHIASVGQALMPVLRDRTFWDRQECLSYTIGRAHSMDRGRGHGGPCSRLSRSHDTRTAARRESGGGGALHLTGVIELPAGGQ